VKLDVGKSREYKQLDKDYNKVVDEIYADLKIHGDDELESGSEDEEEASSSEGQEQKEK
jgi:hypothetical protein